MTAPLLSFEDLRVGFETRNGRVEAVRGVSLEASSGECLGVVGESGSGKSQTFLAALDLLPAEGRIEGNICIAGARSAAKRRALRGREVGMVFQNSMSCLTPHMRIGAQIAEPLRLHCKLSDADIRHRVLDALRDVGFSDPGAMARRFPHQLSGGMRQRVAIAIALICRPRLLIADEPTTALDVTIQAQILDLLSLVIERGTTVILVTHDLGVVARICDRVAVMLAGQLVEVGSVDSLFRNPRHPYTQHLIHADSEIANRKSDDVVQRYCAFANACRHSTQVCLNRPPPVRQAGPRQAFACHNPLESKDSV